MNSGGVTIIGADRQGRNASFLSIAPDFFRTMEIPILLGRPIDRRDVTRRAKVAVVNEFFVEEHFGGQNPLGRHFTTERGGKGVEIEIIGVAANARYSTLKGGRAARSIPAVYLRAALKWAALTFELRAAGDPACSLAAVARNRPPGRPPHPRDRYSHAGRRH